MIRDMLSDDLAKPSCGDAVPSVKARAVEHKLKCWPQFFAAIVAGLKTHDLRRRDDRDFHVGDTLLLREFDPGVEAYTGRTARAVITYITSNESPCALSQDALHPDFCILSIRLL